MEPILPSPDDDDLDDLLRPSPRPPAAQFVLDRLRRTDRRVIVVAVALVAATAVVLVVMGLRARPTPISLPMATAGGGSSPSAPAAGGAAAATTTSAAEGPLVVHVAGAVVRPGLVSVPAGSRTADAIAQAGGASGAADLERVNLAAPVADGMRVYVPAVGQADVPVAVGATPAGGAGVADPAGDPAAPVDLNSATEAQLDTLPGVGPATAAAIVAHREANGPFASVEALEEVRGIGPAKLEQLRDLVVVG